MRHDSVASLYELLGWRVEAYVRRRFSDRFDRSVEDVVQSVWLKVCERSSWVLSLRCPESGVFFCARDCVVTAVRGAGRLSRLYSFRVGGDGFLVTPIRCRRLSPLDHAIVREQLAISGVVFADADWSSFELSWRRMVRRVSQRRRVRAMSEGQLQEMRVKNALYMRRVRNCVTPGVTTTGGRAA